MDAAGSQCGIAFSEKQMTRLKGALTSVNVRYSR
jgi:hypothetical protein